ncbi:hypothetical protein [uncultured Flavobacterium sp.]|uniref:hypothetical protein n=1 Tax=uncultured Flavobacterium sp. TaxID=165435 RepID=UPI0030EF8844|tara:strand:- start:231 stop:674 length:444 start_codon:yes stop_codon:yes gene_type:complete
MRFFYLLILSLWFISCKTTYPKLSSDSISITEKQRVYDFGEKILKSCVTREFIQLSEKEVTKGLAKLSLEQMQKSCDYFDSVHGKFIDMELIEIIDDTYTNNSLIYRYKANFEKNIPLKEIRIWVQKNGKFSGIIYQDWKDEYVVNN